MVALGAAALLAWGLGVPVWVAPAVAGVTPNAGATNEASGGADDDQAPAQAPALDLAELKRLCATDLRRPLFDPTPVKPKATAAAPALSALRVRLIGTANEPGHAMAMLEKSDRTIAWCAEGQSITDGGGVLTLAKVENEKVKVLYGGKEYELVMPKRPPLLGGGKP